MSGGGVVGVRVDVVCNGVVWFAVSWCGVTRLRLVLWCGLVRLVCRVVGGVTCGADAGPVRLVWYGLVRAGAVVCVGVL